MERFKKVFNPLVILLGVIIILIIKLEQSKQEIMKLEEREMVIIHKVDNAGVTMVLKLRRNFTRRQKSRCCLAISPVCFEKVEQMTIYDFLEEL